MDFTQLGIFEGIVVVGGDVVSVVGVGEDEVDVVDVDGVVDFVVAEFEGVAEFEE